jgi:hypothetical protein
MPSHHELIARANYNPLVRSLLLRPHTNCEPTCLFWADCVPADCDEKRERKRNWLRVCREMQRFEREAKRATGHALRAGPGLGATRG